MAHFLDRYRNGEYAEVWAELTALGEQVFSPPLHEEALAVARETMHRVRQNVELLIPRFQSIGYTFGYDWLEAELDNYVWRRKVQISPEAKAYLTPGQIQLAEEYDPQTERDELRSVVQSYDQPWHPPKSDVRAQLAELEILFGPIPLSIYAWYEIVGTVNFVGQPPKSWGAFHLKVPPFSREERRYNLDPLVIHPLENNLNDARSQFPYKDQQPWIYLTISPDEKAKYHLYGEDPHCVQIPNPVMDMLLPFEWHQTTFVNYLRICFRWGGLPGLERCPQVPVKDLAYLVEGLLPI